jgi:hypothetical protein
MLHRSTALVALCLLLLAADVWGLRFYVDPDPAKGDDRRSVGAAQNPDTPFRTITRALKIAHLVPEGRPHVVEIALATYSPSTGETFPLVISQKDIFIEVGGFTEVGGAEQVFFNAQGKSNFFHITASGSEFVLQGFRFQNGVADKGGAVFCQSCSLRVTNNRFFTNRASSGGQAVYVEDGRLRFFNNEIIGDSNQVPGVAVVEVHNSLADTTQRDEIRNNTFFNNSAAAIRTSSNRVDINSNIFLEQASPVIVDESTVDDPLIRFNIFWQPEILFISDTADSITLTRTIVDTLTLEQVGVEVPSFVRDIPDTLITLGETYEFFIDVGDLRKFYTFSPLQLPTGVSFDEVATLGQITWTPAEADTGRSLVEIEIETPFGIIDTLGYPIHVFTAETFPDTADPGPIIRRTFVPDTTGALNALNALVPAFSTAASAGGNLFVDPDLVSVEINNFFPGLDSPAVDSGDSTVALRDRRPGGGGNDRGSKGGPGNPGVPDPGSFTELVITVLPDSVAVEGQTYTYEATLDSDDRVAFVDLIQGPPTMGRAFGGGTPVTWVPTLADTGSFFIKIVVSTSRSEARHFYDLRVKPANEAPVAVSTPDTVALEDELYNYLIEATDPNEDPVTFSLERGPPGLTVGASGLVQWTPGQEDVGSALVEIRLKDPKGAGSTHRYTLQVLNVNDPPVFTSELPTGPIMEDVAFEHILTAADPDPGDTLVFFLQVGPAGASVDSSGMVRWTPAQADVGTAQITVGVRDREGVAADQTFSLEVLQVDDPPFIISDPDTVAFEDSLYRYVIQAVDEEGGEVTFTLDAGTTGLTFADTGVLEWVPAAADTGLHSVSITALDPSGLGSTQAFSIDVQPVNDAPLIVSRDPVASLVAARPGVPVVLSVVAEDEEGDTLSVSWSVNGVTQSSAAGLFFAHTPAVDALDTVTVRLFDGRDATTAFWILDAILIPRANVSTDLVDFGVVELGRTVRVQLEVANDGRGDLNIDSVKVADLQFSAIFTATSIAETDSAALELRFTPTRRGLSEDTITFVTNDPDRLRLQIPVKGVGVVGTRLELDLDPGPGSQGQLSGSARPNGEVMVAVYAVGALELTGYGLELSFDTEVLAFTTFDPSGAEEENLLIGTGNTLILSAAATDGTVRIDVATETGVGRPATGDGLLGIVRFSVVPETQKSGAEIQLDLGRLQSAGAAVADTLLPEVMVDLEIQLLTGDFNFDGTVGIPDFFLFADHFGTTDPLYDLNGNGSVDLSDFFVFAENFGGVLLVNKPVGGQGLAGSTELSLFAVGGGGGERLEVTLSQQAGEPVQGLVLQLDFDPQVLRLTSFKGRPERFSLRVWLPGHTDGSAILLAGGGQEDPITGEGGDLGLILFDRLSPAGGVVRVSAATIHTPDGTTSLPQLPQNVRFDPLPTEFVLYPAYPNPFNPTTHLRYFLPRASQMTLRVFDLAGRAVRTLATEPAGRGYHTVTWNGRDQDGRYVASGLYLVELRVADLRQVSKVMLLK